MSRQPDPRHRVRRIPRPRRLAALALASLALLVAAGGCLQAPEPPTVSGTGPTVLGVFEFEFDGIGTDAMTTSVRRLDDGAVTRSELGTDPVTGVTIASATSSGVLRITGEATYLNQSVVVNNRNSVEITNLTFLAYSGPWALDGSAFRIVEDSDGEPLSGVAQMITPAVGTVPSELGGQLVLDAPSLNALTTVAYDEDDLNALLTALTPLSFVDTVLPYGFVATATDLRSRTIPAREGGEDGQGVLSLGFRIPDDSANRVVFRAVAVTDSEYRLTLPYEYQGTENLSAFLDLVGQISQGNDNEPVNAVLLGADAARENAVPVNADDWVDGDGVVDLTTLLQFTVLPDVRLSGPDTAPASFWVGDGEGDANTATTDVAALTVEFKTPRTYTFVPPEGANLDVFAIGGGGAGVGRTANGFGAGGGGGASARSLIETPSGDYTVEVGAGGAPDTNGGNGDPASESEFRDADANTLVRAAAGSSGTVTTGGSGGSALDSIGDSTFTGGAGAAGGGQQNQAGGAGGGAAGDSNGSAGSGNTGGTAGDGPYAGDGGSTPEVGANGNPGIEYGGGGSGGRRIANDPSVALGGAGANGIVVVTYGLQPSAEE